MAFRKRFVLSDESINTYGFWIKSDGLDLSAVQKNCPLYYEHRTWEIPCGHVENITLKDGVVTGDIVIEGGNEVEKEYIRKIENGDIKGCSFGIDPFTWSDAPEDLKQGQTMQTLMKGQPYEVSLAPLPGNQNALAMKNGKNILTLDANSKYDFIPDLNTQINMKKIAVLLGMAETSTEQQICDALAPVIANAGKVVNLQKTVEAMGAELPEAEKEIFVTLCAADMTKAVKYLNLHKAPAGVELIAEEVTDENLLPQKKQPVKMVGKVSELIKKGGDATKLAADGKDSFDYLQRFNPVELKRIKNEDAAKYAQLVADYSRGVRYSATK